MMPWIRSAIFFLGSVFVLSAGDAVLPAAKLGAVLGEKAEVQFLAFTGSDSVIIGGTAPYASRAGGAARDVSRLAWTSRLPADWVEWNTTTGALRRILTDASPKDAARKLGLSPAVPAAWTPGDAKKMSAGEAQAALQPKSFQPAVDAVSPDGMFAAVTNYEDKDDELGAMVFLRKGNKGWRRLGQDRQGVFLSGPRFSPDGSLLACQYQTDGYDGPEPWALVSTKSGVDLLAAARPASKGLLPFALAVKTDALAVGWSDGSVTVQRLDRLER